MTLGGVSNQLAFGLLKICFIMFLIAVVIGGIVFPEVVFEALRRMKENTKREPYNEDLAITIGYHRKEANHRRNNSQ